MISLVILLVQMSGGYKMIDLASALDAKNGQEFTVKYRVVNNTLEYYNDIVEEWRSVKIDELSLQVGDIYYVPNLDAFDSDLTIKYEYGDDKTDYMFKDRGIMCRTKEEAQKLAEYLLRKAREYRENE